MYVYDVGVIGHELLLFHLRLPMVLLVTQDFSQTRWITNSDDGYD